MTKIIVGDLHQKLADAGIPITTVRLTREQQVELEFGEAATDEQKAAARQIVDSYDQADEDANELTDADIDSAKTVGDLKALLKKMRKG